MIFIMLILMSPHAWTSFLYEERPKGHLFSRIFISISPDCKTVPSDPLKDYTDFLEGFKSEKFNYLQKALLCY